MANVGTLDRRIRFIPGAVLLSAPVLPSFAGVFAAWGGWKFLLAAVGIVMIATAVFRFCPAYTLFGLQTCPVTKT